MIRFLRRSRPAVFASALLLAGLRLCMPGFAGEEPEGLRDGQVLVDLTFDDDTTQGFTTYTNGGSCDISNAENALAVDIHSCGNLDYANQVYWDGFSLNQGCVYTYSFDISCDIERKAEYRLQLNGGDYHAYQGEIIDVGPVMRTICVDWTMSEESDPAPRIVFNLGKMEDMKEDPGEHRVLIDNVRLTVKDASSAQAAESLPEIPLLAVNQIGFQTENSKGFVIRDDSEEGAFYVISRDTGETVFEGDFAAPFYNRSTDTRVKTGDFTALTEPGTYYIHAVSGGLEADSTDFEIGGDVYSDLFSGLVHMLYLQRCGTATTALLAGDFAHDICHHTDAVIYGSDQTKEVSGGWHDAGDYGRYVVSGTKAAADLLEAYEEYGIDADDLNIPESGNGIPDLLDEVRYELEWLLKMQDPGSGGVYHKVTGFSFPGEVMPEEEAEPLVLAPVSTAATGDFAAIMAKASVIWRDIDAEFSASMLTAAHRAWDYVKDLDDSEGFKNPSEISTGEYPDRGTDDEIFWAAVELYLAEEVFPGGGMTPAKDGSAEEEDLSEEGTSFGEEIRSRYNSYLRPGLGWNRMNSYAFYDLLKASPEGMDEVLIGCREQLINAADDILKKSEKDAYGMSLESAYPWGSNMTATNNGITLLMAGKLTGDEKYPALAGKHLDYLLGCNGTGYCFVTGYGTVSPEHPHHRPSQAAGKPMPGMLIGGPDSSLEDPYAKGVLTGRPPALCYVDHVQSYSTNEVCVYWNSPMIWLLAGQMRL